MNVRDLTVGQFADRLADDGVAIRSGPFVSRIAARLSELAAPLHGLYRDFPLEQQGLVDFHVSLRPSAGFSRWNNPQVEFLFDGQVAFRPFPRRIALPMLEWGLNWCVYTHANQYLIIHAASVERDGRALVLAGRPGSGKSTLCAALVHRGWRLLSDELALVCPEDGRLLAIARPISLKNESIEVIRRFAPDAVFGPQCEDTHKGRVAHVRPPADSIRRADETVPLRYIVLPRFEVDADTRLAEITKARAFFRLADNSFNYHLLGAAAFTQACRIVDHCLCRELIFSSLDEAVDLLSDLARSTPTIGGPCQGGP